MAFRRILLALALGSTLLGLPLQGQEPTSDTLPVPREFVERFPFDEAAIHAAYAKAASGEPTQIDVYAAFDPLALQKAGGRVALTRMIRAKIAACTDGALASGANLRYRVVVVEALPAGIVVKGSLPRTMGNVDKSKKIFERARKFNADLIQVWLGEGDGKRSGLAYHPVRIEEFVPSAGVSLTVSTGNGYTECHELGHNSGGGHGDEDPWYEKPEDVDFPFAKGYLDQGTQLCDWMRTRCFAAPRVSGPKSRYTDPFTGKEIVLGDIDHNNARAMRLTAALLADYARRRTGSR